MTCKHVAEDYTDNGTPVLVDQTKNTKLILEFRTVTCSRERSRTSICSSDGENDQKSSSSRITSCQLASAQRLQNIQQNSKEMIREMGMWSYSSCAKLFQKYNCSFTGISDICTSLADNAWLTANPEKCLTHEVWMHSLSRTM